MTRPVIAALLLAIALLTGCSTRAARRPAIPAQCEAMCFVPCKDDVRWNADPNDPGAWDILAGEVVPALRDKLATCEVRRKACEQCLQRLDKAKVIDLGR